MNSILWERDYWRALADVLAAALQKVQADYDEMVDAYWSQCDRLHARLNAAVREVRDG